MGQQESTGSTVSRFAPTQLMVYATKLLSQAETIKQVAKLNYDQFLESVKQLNQITNEFCGSSGKKLIIAVKKGTDDSMFWKGTVRICCIKVDNTTGLVDSTRILSLRQYIRLYNEIIRQAGVVTSNDEFAHLDDPLNTSKIISEITTLEDEDDPNECVICMERTAKVVLTCDHSYCEQCIDQWSAASKSCPMCRKVQELNDTWVLTDVPDNNELASDVQNYLMGITEKG